VDAADTFAVAVGRLGVELARAAQVTVACVKVVGAHLPFCLWLQRLLKHVELFLLFRVTHIFNAGLFFVLQVPPLNTIISRLLASPGCRKLLGGDGITTPELSINGIQGIFEAASVDTRSVRKNVPAVGQAAGIAKNLDEYQFLICSLVPSLPDSDPSKLQLQKYRVAIVAAFAKLAALLKEINPDGLAQWNAHARSLLEGTSEAYVKAKSNTNLQVANHKEAFEFFGVPEDVIDAVLGAFYDQ